MMNELCISSNFVEGRCQVHGEVLLACSVQITEQINEIAGLRAEVEQLSRTGTWWAEYGKLKREVERLTREREYLFNHPPLYRYNAETNKLELLRCENCAQETP